MRITNEVHLIVRDQIDTLGSRTINLEADLQAEVTQTEGHKKEKAALKEVANMKHQN